MPICPGCQKLVSETHYERHFGRCGTEHAREARSLRIPSGTVRSGSLDRGVASGPLEPDEERRDWRRVALALFVIFLLIGSLVVFFLLYALSLL